MVDPLVNVLAFDLPESKNGTKLQLPGGMHGFSVAECLSARQKGARMETSMLAGYHSLIEIDVAWGEMDAFGHVNNAVYFRYFESARIKYLSEIGWDEFEPGILPILGEINARFRRPVEYPDRLMVGTRPTKLLDEYRVEVEHLLISEKVGVATIGNSVIVAFTPGTGKVAIPERCRIRIEEQLQQANLG